MNEVAILENQVLIMRALCEIREISNSTKENLVTQIVFINARIKALK